jgi:Tfp pilus assembly protein FimT
VIVLTSVLAVFAMPSLDGVFGFRDEAWRGELIAALRNARQTAVAHRRLVCVSITSQGVVLRIAATNPASACTHALNGPDGQSTYATGSGTATSASPSDTVHFQPSGRATLDAAGTTSTVWQITITGQNAITLLGETGHVE